MIMDEMAQRTATLIGVAIGSFLFVMVILIKVDVMYDQAKAKVEMISTQMDWESYLEKKAVEKAIVKRKNL